FLDLVEPGVAFDSVDAKALIADGQLVFDPELTMSGPSASFRLTGEADLINEKLKQRLEVDIPLTNNLPLASVLLGAPQVGGAIYLVEKALGTKIIKVGKTDYRIEGSFAEPQVSLIPPFSKKKD
ncbi:MAG: AsmA-like C-terminal region-containing protein, partial [Litorivicinaceae bacterium]